MYKEYSVNELKVIAKKYSYSFRKCKATYNNQTMYAMFNEFNECVSVKTSRVGWNDIMNHGLIAEKIGSYGMGYH